MPDEQLFFPAAHQLLDDAANRHSQVLAYVYTAITLGHLAYHRQRDLVVNLVPGTPHIRRVRTEINDDSWRFCRSITQPLIDLGLISQFIECDNGEVMVLPDGLHMRIKKGNRDGSTSNYPTAKIVQMDEAGSWLCLYDEATELDQFILDGHWIDVVFVVDETDTGFTQVGLRFSAAKVSPLTILDPPSDAQLALISPEAFNLVLDARNRLIA